MGTKTSSDLEPGEKNVCPVCGSTDFDDGPSGIGPVCVICGAVVASDVEADILPSSSSDHTKDREWSDYYSVSNSTEQQIASAFAFLEDLSDSLTASTDVRERTAELYGDLALNNITDGRSMKAVIAATIIFAGRELNEPHPTGRVAELAGVELPKIRSAQSAMRSELGELSPYCPPGEYLPELAQFLELDTAVEATAQEVLEELDEYRLGGKHPAAVAGAALYLSAEGDITQRAVAQVAGVTTETVRVRVKMCREVWQAESRARVDSVGGG